MHYADGRVYVGFFHLGEKHGLGVLKSETMTYDGEWQLNTMHGTGVLQTKEFRIEGTF